MTDKLKDSKDVIALYFDNGYFHSFALKLAETYKKVYYAPNWKQSFPCIENAVVGTQWENGERIEGFDDLPVETIENPFDYLDEIDIAIFPDVCNGDLAAYLLKQGKAVFGSMHGEDLELERWEAHQIFEENGLDMQAAKRVVGIDNLRKFLSTAKGKKWIKVGKYRKMFETFSHDDMRFTDLILDRISCELGPLKHIVEFIVEDDIPDAVESGYDGFNIDGEYPANSVEGVEVKDKAYAGQFKPYKNLTAGVLQVNEKLSPILKQLGYRGAISTEIRNKGDKHYLLEPTCRLPSPPNELYQEMYADIGDIVWKIGNGIVPDIKPIKKFGLQYILQTEGIDEHMPIWFPEKYRKNIKLKNPIIIDNQYYILKIDGMLDAGAVITIGDSFEDCKKQLEEIVPQVEYEGAETNLDAVDKAVSEYEKVNGKE